MHFNVLFTVVIAAYALNVGSELTFDFVNTHKDP